VIRVPVDVHEGEGVEDNFRDAEHHDPGGDFMNQFWP
jgi:hypothetical protein